MVVRTIGVIVMTVMTVGVTLACMAMGVAIMTMAAVPVAAVANYGS